MTYLQDHAFMATVNSRIQDRVRCCQSISFQAVSADLLDRGLVPQRKSMWDWARRVCGGEEAL